MTDLGKVSPTCIDLDLNEIVIEETESLPNEDLFRKHLFPDPSKAPKRLWLPMFGSWRVARKNLPSPNACRIWSSSLEPNTEYREKAGAISLGWRGITNLHESLGIVSDEMIRGIKATAPDLSLQFYPFTKSEWATQANEYALKFDNTHHYEVQVPGGYPSAARVPCLRFVHDEFGLFDSTPVSAQDQFWVPSQWCSWVLQQAVDGKPIHVVPHGVDAHTFCSTGRTLLPQKGNTLRFLYVGTTLSRKGFDLLLDAWEQASPANCELVLKILPSAFNFVSRRIERLPKSVHTITQSLSKADVAALYRSCDVLVAPSRAEGFGMPILEAMSCGLPVIIPRGTAMEDFCPDAAAYFIPSHLYRVKWYEGTNVFFIEADREALANIFLQIANERELITTKGIASSEHAKLFTWKEAGQRFVSKLL